jgi:hypothetical protein
MTNKDYKAALETAQKELDDLLKLQAQTEQEIMRRRRTIASLMELVKEESNWNSAADLYARMLSENFTRYTLEQSLTEDIRKIIREAGENGIAKDALRGELSKLGKSIEAHSNPSGTIHSIVKRLIDKDEAEEHTDPMTGYKTIRWKKGTDWGELFLRVAKEMENKNKK